MKIAVIVLTIIMGIAVYPTYVEVFDEMYSLISWPTGMEDGFVAKFIGLGVYLLIIAIFIMPLWYFFHGKNKSEDGPPDMGGQL